MKVGRLRLGRPESNGKEAPAHAGPDLGALIALLRRYVIQETLEPIKHLGRVLALGVAGALCFGIGGVFLVVAVLRLIQAESGFTFSGNWTFAPYLLAAVAGIGLAALFAFLSFRYLGDGYRSRNSTREEK